jgi:hypothetical protein
VTPLPVAHLAKRFVWSLWPGPPASLDESWAQARLSPSELTIWDRMSNPDRRHAVAVARAVERALDGVLDDGAGDAVVTAALLHDCGKVVSGLGTLARVGATLVWAALDDDVAGGWLDSPVAIKRRLVEYRRHPELGAVLLAAADADPLVVAWAAEHHLPPAGWTVEPRYASILKACDDD